MKLPLATLAFYLLTVTAPSALAGTVFGLSSSSPGMIFTIDTTTGVATKLVDIAGNIQTSLVDISFLNGVLYATDVFDNDLFFGTIDLATGVYTPINDQGGSTNWHALAAIPSQNLLYAVDLNGKGDPLVSVTPGGVITPIGATDTNIRDLAYDSNHNILYGVDGDANSLVTIDPLTGHTTQIGPLGVSGITSGLAFDNLNNVLYFNDANGRVFYSVNTSTGTATKIGSNGLLFPIDGLADVGAPTTAPEPNTVTWLATGVAALWLRKRLLASGAETNKPSPSLPQV